MKLNQIFLIILICSLFQINCAQSSNATDDDILFPSHSTELYTYTMHDPIEKPAHGQKIEKTVTITKTNHMLNSGFTRTKTTIAPSNDNTMITTIETWITKNPSWAKSWYGLLAATYIVMFSMFSYIKYQDYLYEAHFDKNIKNIDSILERRKAMVKNIEEIEKNRILLFDTKQEQNPDINFDIVKKMTEGFSLDQLYELFNEAGKSAQEQQVNRLSMHDINRAYLTMTVGNIAPESDHTNNVKNPATFHEMGHAFITVDNKNNDILHFVQNEPRLKAGGSIHSLKAYYSNTIDKNIQDFKDFIDVDLAGLITQQIYKKPLPNSLHPELFTGKKLTEKSKILQFLSEPAGIYDLQDARIHVDNIMNRDENLESLDDQQKQNLVDDMLVESYHRTYDRIAKNKEKIENGVQLMLHQKKETAKNMLSGDELYNLWKVDKPLYEFEQGPLPKSLESHYAYRGQ
jgi:hypothetical protein